MALAKSSAGARRHRSRLSTYCGSAAGLWLIAHGLTACSLDGRAVGLVPDASVADAGSSGAGGDGQGGSAPDGGSSGDSTDPTGGSGGSSAGSGPAGSGGDAGDGPDSGVPLPPLPACAEQYLRVGTAQAATTNAEGTFSSSCAPGVSDDASFFWVAPSADYYAIDTVGSSFDTTLSLVTPACDQELTCNDDGPTAPQSEILRRFALAEEVIVVVDGKSGSFGDVVVNANPITCPAIDADRQPLPLASTTADGANVHTGTCGGAGLREKAFRYEAPESGLYRFSVTGTGIEPALHVERGPRCGGSLLGCNIGGGESNPAVVVRRLAQGEVVTLIVDSAAGAGTFSLNVEPLPSAVCPDQAALANGSFITATLEPSGGSLLTGSCTPERQIVTPGGTFPLPEHSYPFNVPAGYGCSMYLETSGPIAVYVLDGLSCGGSELACLLLDSTGGEDRVDFDFGDFTGGRPFEYTVVVESSSPFQGAVNYTFSIACFSA